MSDALAARWSSHWTPREVADRLTGTTTPWCVAAGWALDLFRGRQTRPHGDIEIAIPADGAARPHLSPDQRAALAGMLSHAHPGHRWLAHL
ncbi:hypothetical protein ACTI_65580 [Actinoplanes sp. OR16]|uniref:nucleotidyltransferase domain-containing protein n=1 Tax=Actinoplanes sp. OR16 TaxID=946334 RepID=UPI000F71EB5E|nr:hypothetical protein [Actinoplanes sp. OR16]BBH69873.1 hypothetical protein ACTI_65580 [Actinoplanes sp. OR16]